MDRDDPNTWTSSYVSFHQAECMSLLWETNQLVINCVRKGNYLAAIAGLDRITNGLNVLHNAKCGNFRSHMGMFSLCIASITAFGAFSAPESKRRETAVANFKDAYDFSAKEQTKSIIRPIIRELESGTSLERIKTKYAPDFPQSVIEILTNMSSQLSGASTPSSGAASASSGTASGVPSASSRGTWIKVILIAAVALFLIGRLWRMSAWITNQQDAPGGPEIATLESLGSSEAGQVFSPENVPDVSTGEQPDYEDKDALPALSEMAAELCGKWSRNELSVSPSQGLITIQDYTFQSDGAFISYLRRYETGTFDSSWYCAQDEIVYGTYAFDGSALQLFQESGQNAVWTMTCEITDDVLTMTGSVYAPQGVEVYRRTEEEADPMDYMTVLSEYNSRISGLWKTVRREGDEIWTHTYLFSPDGTFDSHSVGYEHADNTNFPGESGWYVMPMGFPSFGGTYYYDGNSLILSYAADEYFGQGAEIEAVSVQMYDGFAEFDEIRYLAADAELSGYDERQQDLESLCELFGVDSNP